MSTIETQTPQVHREQDQAQAMVRIPVEQLPSDDNLVAFPVRVEQRPSFKGEEHIEADPATELDADHIAYRVADLAINTAIETTQELKDREATRQSLLLGDSRDRKAERKSERAFSDVEGFIRPAGATMLTAVKKPSKLEQRQAASLKAIQSNGRTRSHGRLPRKA